MYHILGSYDNTVFVWDIGGRKGTVYELHGHRQKVTHVRYLSKSKQVMSAGEDGNLVLWDMAAQRIEVGFLHATSTYDFMCIRVLTFNP